MFLQRYFNCFIQGPRGLQGTIGYPGSRGTKGDAGPRGTNGEKGAPVSHSRDLTLWKIAN